MVTADRMPGISSTPVTQPNSVSSTTANHSGASSPCRDRLYRHKGAWTTEQGGSRRPLVPPASRKNSPPCWSPPEFVLGSFSRRSCECYFLFSRKTFAHLSLVVNGALRTAILLEAE